MDRIQELIRVLSEEKVSYREELAKASHFCKICGDPATSFTSPRYELEYSISSICQLCQEYYFPK